MQDFMKRPLEVLETTRSLIKRRFRTFGVHQMTQCLYWYMEMTLRFPNPLKSG